jgi:PAS domain S-box-containing protein
MGHQQPRILIVDRDPEARASLRRLLLDGERPDCEIVEAESGASAAQLLQAADPAAFGCVLLADALPDCGALQQVEAMQAAAAGSQCPILVLIGRERGIGKELLRAGAADCLDRSSLTPASLALAIENVMERSAMAAIQARDAHGENLLDLIDEGYCVIEMLYDDRQAPVDYRFVAANPSFERHTGLSNVIGKRMLEIAPRLERLWVDRYAAVAATGTPTRFQHQAAALDGRWFDVFALRLGGLGSRKVAVMFNDISARLQAEQALRSSEERFRHTFERAAIGIAHVGLDGRWLRVNPALSRITGYPSEALTTMNWDDVTHPDDVADSHAQLQALLLGHRDTLVADQRYLRKDGSLVWINLTVSVLRDDPGQALHLIAAIEDISDKKAALEELGRQQRFIERITHVVPGALHVYDLAQQRDVWVNRHLGTVLGYSAEQIATLDDRFLREVMHPDDVSRLQAHVAGVAASADSEVLEFEYRLRRPDGEWRWFRSCDTIFRRDALGHVIEFVGTATDVTERNLIATELTRALFAAERASHAKSDFLSSMSHELRSPLNAILGFAQLIDSGSPQPSASQRESIGQILKAGWYLLELINEILDLAMIESGKLSLSLEPVSVVEVLDDCRAMFETQAQQRSIRLEIAAVEANCIVMADRTRLKQICVNLLSNAIKYNHAGGSVRVTCSRQLDERVRIGVQDTGDGLTPAQLAQLYQPFDRLGRQAGAEQGTGIGLVVSKRLVEMMGGVIGAQSAVGVGSRFWIELPAAAAVLADDIASATAAHIVTRAMPGSSMRTVLCVEDNPANLLLVERILARRGDIRLLSATTAIRGIEMAREIHPDLILMDINLPGISGIAALSIIAADPDLAHVPVVALSANAMPRDIANGLALGFFRYLTKPIRIAEFAAALDAAFALPQRRSAPSDTQDAA